MGFDKTSPQTEETLHRWIERSKKSQKLFAVAKNKLPLGVGSHFRAIDPNPVFIERAQGSRMWDADGNEYIDFALCFGVLFVGHAHPKIVETVQQQITRGSIYATPHRMEAELADELMKRAPMALVRFTNSGTESTMHALRTARGYTGRSMVIKMEGGYHGCHDNLLASTKPAASKVGEMMFPNVVPGSGGIPEENLHNTLVATFNNLDSVKILFKKYPKKIAAVITEPIMMNTGVCPPENDFLKKLQELCKNEGACFILDEVKTGAKIAYGGACEVYDVQPDLICFAKVVGGGLPLGAFGGTKEVMSVLEDFSVLHVGTYNANPLCVATGLTVLRDILEPSVYEKTNGLNRRLIDSYNRLIKKHQLPWHTETVNNVGTIHFTTKRIRNYRDWLTVNVDVWRRWWHGMCNEGIIPTPYGWDEQWTISVQHSEADIDRHLEAFDKVAPMLKEN